MGNGMVYMDWQATAFALSVGLHDDGRIEVYPPSGAGGAGGAGGVGLPGGASGGSIWSQTTVTAVKSHGNYKGGIWVDNGDGTSTGHVVAKDGEVRKITVQGSADDGR